MAHSRIKICLFTFLFANIIALIANGFFLYQTKSFDQQKDERVVRLQDCVFKDVPSNLLRYNLADKIVGRYGMKNELEFQIDQSGKMAKRIDVIVNQPARPVVLYLNNYDPIVWVIHRTKGTEIYAVFTEGYYDQAVAGVDHDTPVITSSRKNPSLCRAYRMEDASGQLIPFDMEASSNNPYPFSLQTTKEDTIILGDPDFLQEDLIEYTGDLESRFKDPGPLAGDAGIDEAVQKGILVKPTSAEIRDWKEKISAIDGGEFKRLARPPLVHTMHGVYLVLSEFHVPAGLTGAHLKTFIVTKGVPLPSGYLGHSTVYDDNEGKCYYSGIRKELLEMPCSPLQAPKSYRP